MPQRTMHRWLTVVYASTIFLSAFLLFEVQPVMSKFILPWFGGSPAVWTTCMLFFQTILFAGYAYAHCSERCFRPMVQGIVHVGLLLAAVWLLPIAPDSVWKPRPEDQPTWRILLLLAASVGLPYFVLSATGPLVQAWFSRSYPGRSPYRLYALSNVGSLLALLSYPFCIEPALDVFSQTHLWAYGFAAFAVLCAGCAIAAARVPRLAAEPAVNAANASEAEVPTASRRALWLVLPAFASLCLLATTNHVCQDVAVMPFLWVVPLSLYLLSFIICFDHERWYQPKFFGLAALVTLILVAAMDQLITGGSGIAFSFSQEMVLHFAALFFVCMLCHGELVRLKPHPRYLTSFYLMISAGGALGGIFVSLIAPRLFSTFFEWKIGLVGGCVLAALVVLATQQTTALRRKFRLAAPLLFLAFLGLNTLPQLQTGGNREFFMSARNFYGVVSVLERDVEQPEQRKFNFYSGRIVHGVQFAKPEKRRQATAYFGPQAGIGQLLGQLKARQPRLRVGIIGLGVGTLATYARPADTFRFYEINDEVLKVAREHFTYLSDCPAKVEVVLGDGRLSLERESPQQFDLLVLDAFSGDAVPTHLLTVEAFKIYQRHLAAGAPIAVNISNRYLNLEPVVAAVGERFGYRARHVSSAGKVEDAQFPAEWMLLERANTAAAFRTSTLAPRRILWTDHASNLFQILK